MTREVRVGYKSGVAIRPNVCAHCGRNYYADDIATPGVDRPCPALLQRALHSAEEKIASLEIQLAEQVGDLRFTVP